MDGRSELAESLRTALHQINTRYTRARGEGREYDARMLASMRASTEFALRVLTDSFWNISQPRMARTDIPDYQALSEEQRERLETVLSPLEPVERKLLWLCLGHDVSVEAAAVALDLTKREATAVYEAVVRKVKAIQRNVRAGGPD